jgi:tripartite ATP-independent transporter DctM subunit
VSEISATPRATGLGARIEDGLMAVVVIGIVLLPLADVVAREVFDTYVEGAESITAHLTLVIGLMGAAIAARDGRLLSLATGALLPEGRVRESAAIFAAMVGSAVATVLAYSGWRLLQVHREAGYLIAHGIPVWIADLAFPIGFGLIALRLVMNASSSWAGRGIAALGIVAGVLLWQKPELFAGIAIWPGVVAIAVAAICGMPIFGLLGGLAVFLYMVEGIEPANALIGSYGQLISEGLACIPLFTLTGFLLAEGRTSERLLRLFRAFFGWMPGGTAIVTTALCAFFTMFTGGSGVTILALGGLLMPALLKDGYRERFSLGLLTAAGSLGLLFAPALPLILYGVVAQVSITQLFAGGVLPGALMLVFLSALGVREGLAVRTPRPKFRMAEAGAALWEAKWELLLPVVIIGSLYLGATTTQSAALAALTALIVQRFVHRDLPNFAAIRRATADSIGLVGGVLVILAVANGFTSYLLYADVPTMMTTWVTEHIHTRETFLLALNGFLLVVGCLMDIFSAIFVIVPLILPISQHFEVNPVHLGIIFIANLELGYLTPPVGLNLFVSSYRFNKPVLEVARASLPMLIALAVAVLLITYWPWLTTGLAGMIE